MKSMTSNESIQDSVAIYIESMFDIRKIMDNYIKFNKKLSNPILNQVNKIELFDPVYMKKVLNQYEGNYIIFNITKRMVMICNLKKYYKIIKSL